jgi:papain fold toxin 1 (glutamine deamidase) of polymorphic toxin system
VASKFFGTSRNSLHVGRTATIPYTGEPFLAESGEIDAVLAGTIRNANPTRSSTNCVNCVVAVDAILSGRPASALPLVRNPFKC